MSRPHSTTVSQCWQCGAVASPDCTYQAKLVATARANLNALGHCVQRGKRHDRLTINVPRCEGCRTRRRWQLVLLIVALLLGAVLGQIIIPRFWPSLGIAPPWNPSIESRGTTAEAIGAVICLTIVLIVTVRQHRQAGFRTLSDYPAVLQAKALGWHAAADSQ